MGQYFNDYYFLFSKQGSLCDGSKIVVFSGTLEPDSGMGSKDVQVCNLKLLVNSVRKAFISSPMGFVYPPMLTRGLSLKSISIGTLCALVLRSHFPFV